jgi:hypothetical protein
MNIRVAGEGSAQGRTALAADLGGAGDKGPAEAIMAPAWSHPAFRA